MYDAWTLGVFLIVLILCNVLANIICYLGYLGIRRAIAIYDERRYMKQLQHLEAEHLDADEFGEWWYNSEPDDWYCRPTVSQSSVPKGGELGKQ